MLKKVVLPNKVDLRDQFSIPFDQGELNSCTSFCISGAIEYDLRLQNDPIVLENGKRSYIPSPLFIYYNERKIEGKIDKNAPVFMRDGIKSVVKQGVCSMETWPYDTEKFKIEPPQQAYEEAKSCEVISYLKLDINLEDLKNCLYERYPFVFGFHVPASFLDDAVTNTGIMSNASQSEIRMGGHAVLAVGYDDDRNHFIVRNSNGPEWGDKGYFYMPFDFVLGQYESGGELKGNTFSFWTIRRTT
jgi:C1A family cysteine protease